MQALGINVPVLVTSETMQGTGQLPKFEDDLFEVPIGGNGHLAIDGKAKDALRGALVRNDPEDALAILNGICTDIGLQTLPRLPAALWDEGADPNDLTRQRMGEPLGERALELSDTGGVGVDDGRQVDVPALLQRLVEHGGQRHEEEQRHEAQRQRDQFADVDLQGADADVRTVAGMGLDWLAQARLARADQRDRMDAAAADALKRGR